MTERRTPELEAAGICSGGPVDTSKVRTIDLTKRGGFPDAVVDAHTGEKFRFYEDRIKDKVFLVNFMTIKNEETYPVTANLKKVAERLGDHMGRDVFINSFTMDPENDTLERLQEFALAHDVPSGWCFLRARRSDDAGAVMQRMYHFNRGGVATGLVFYGNGRLQAWGSFPGLIEPDDAANRVKWVFATPKPEKIRRAGPRKLAELPELYHRRDV